MTLSYPDACSWAQARSRNDTPRLGMLEAMAFQSHPEAVATFGADGAAIAGVLRARPLTARARVRDAVLTPFAILAALTPIIGMAVLGASRFFQGLPSYDAWIDARFSVPIAVVAFWGAVGTLLLAAILWAVRGAVRSGPLLGFGVISVICGLAAAFGMPSVAERDGYPLPSGALIPVWMTVVLGALVVVAALVRYRVPGPQESESPSPGTASDAVAAVEGIPQAEQDLILADRDAALHLLADRGLIDEDLLRRALAAPPGTLFTLDATGRTTA